MGPANALRATASSQAGPKEVLGETMITTTVRRALGHNVDGYTDSRGLLTGHKLYLIRDGDIVFYIGQSAQPLIRLQEHMGWTWQGNQSTIGKLIEDNAPESGKWTYELWKVEECEQYVTEYRVNTFPDSWQKLHPSYDIDEAEEALIKHFKPCLNSAMNPNPTPLPGRYIKYNRSQEHLNMLEKLFGISQEEGE